MRKQFYLQKFCFTLEHRYNSDYLIENDVDFCILPIDPGDKICYSIFTSQSGAAEQMPTRKEGYIMIWLGLFVAFLLIEASTVALMSIWFAAGSLIALLVALLGGPIWLQITLFFLVSAGLLACLRPMVRRFVKPGLTATNVDSVIGTRGYVLSDVDNENASGRVKLGGMEWTARSTSGAVIPKGTLVQVDKVEGVKAFVSPAEVSAEVK